jgi:hypothetical protein
MAGAIIEFYEHRFEVHAGLDCRFLDTRVELLAASAEPVYVKEVQQPTKGNSVRESIPDSLPTLLTVSEPTASLHCIQ